MNDMYFQSKGHLTLGIELEVQLLHPKTLDLHTFALEILQKIGNHGKIKPEIFQSMIEINTDICENVHSVKNCIKDSFVELDKVCNEIGILYATTGTHPFARYSDRIIYPATRYNELIDRNQWIARRLSIFGLHVHIGMLSKEECISMMNFFQHFLPQFAALSASSPFWQAKDTGLQSSRLSVFEASPTSGHCDYINDWESFENLVFTLKKCRAINSTKDLWWDIRPAPHFGSLEIRICDGTATFHELLGIVAYIHLLAHYYARYNNDKTRIHSLIGSDNTFIPLWLIRENKWRAMRYGLDMEIIKVDGTVIPFKEDTLLTLSKLSDIIEELNYSTFISYIKDILKNGNSAIRQQRKYLETNSFRQVTRMNAKECYASFLKDQKII